MLVRSVGITGVGSYVPKRIVTNEDLAKMVETSDDWIKGRTGISQRRLAASDQATSDLAFHAASAAIKDAGIKAEELDLIIVATVTPDMMFPATACILSEKLGLHGKPAFDLEAACSGFIYGLTIGAQFIATGVYQNVLVVGAEKLSSIVNWDDRNTCVLFGDGAGAAVLQPVEKGKGILSFHLGADGAGKNLLKMPAGGSAVPASKDTVEKGWHFIHMSGNEVFKFAVRVMEEAASKSLDKAGLDKGDIDFVIPHQANIRIIDAAMRRLNLPLDKAYINLGKYGNMSSASIPVALDEAYRDNKINNGDVVVMVGFGAGLTWGSMVIKWCK
ncbi:MAG: beta-ketoacyl-ACP synthase III [Bacillota bacterium]|jgi:3-oxoacyl-[acyl-carrier-protein] synthase-3